MLKSKVISAPQFGYLGIGVCGVDRYVQVLVCEVKYPIIDGGNLR